MAKRGVVKGVAVNVVLDKEIIKTLRDMQGDKIKRTNKGCSFSGIVNKILKDALK